MRLFSLFIGYLCGCFLTGDRVAHYKTGRSAFAIGSGNPGMANILGQLGVKWAAITLLGDILKTVIPCVLCRYVLFRSLGSLAILYAGVGTALGHGYPFWHGFRGGKGVAVTCACLMLFSPLWGLLANLAGLGIVLVTGYLAVGALAIPSLFLIPAFLKFGAEAGFVTLANVVLLFSLHGDSLRRIRNGSEKKTDLLSKIRSHNE